MSQNKIIGTDILLELLEAVLHSIIYYRKFYPKEIFKKKHIYGTTVYISLHPEINKYIKNIVASVKILIEENDNNLKSVNLLCYNESEELLEKFILKLDKLHVNITEADPYFVELKQALGNFILKLSLSEIYFEPLPVNSTFIINVVTKHAAYVTLNENSLSDCVFPWIVDNKPREIENGSLLPIQNIETNYLVLQCYAVKQKLSKIEKQTIINCGNKLGTKSIK